MKANSGLSFGTLVSGLILILGKVIEELILNLSIAWLTGIWWIIIASLILAGIIVFPYKSFLNPSSKLEFGIDNIDFGGTFHLEPTIDVTLKVRNISDIDQVLERLYGKLAYKAGSAFELHTLQHPIIFVKPTRVKAKDDIRILVNIPISSNLVERFRKYMDTGQYIYWTGTIEVNVSATIWRIQRGKYLEDKELPEFAIVPRGLAPEGLQHAM